MAGTAVLPAASPRIRTPGPPWNPCPPPTNSPNNSPGRPHLEKRTRVKVPARSVGYVLTDFPLLALPTAAIPGASPVRPPAPPLARLDRRYVPPYRTRPVRHGQPVRTMYEYSYRTQQLGGLVRCSRLPCTRVHPILTLFCNTGGKGFALPTTPACSLGLIHRASCPPSATATLPRTLVLLPTPTPTPTPTPAPIPTAHGPCPHFIHIHTTRPGTSPSLISIKRTHTTVQHHLPT